AKAIDRHRAGRAAEGNGVFAMSTFVVSLLHRRAPRVALALAATAIAGLPAAAQTADVDPFHWGYAAAFGRGAYRLGDGTEAEIYRAEFKPPLRRNAEAGGEGGGPIVRLVLPVTLGLQNLDDDLLP